MKARTDKVSVLTPRASGQTISCLLMEQRKDNHSPQTVHARHLAGTRAAGECCPGVMCNFAGQQLCGRDDSHKGMSREGECVDTQHIWSTNQLLVCGTEKDNHLAQRLRAQPLVGTQAAGESCPRMMRNLAGQE